MNPCYGAENDKQQWWDGTAWRNHQSFDGLRLWERAAMDAAYGRDPDGVFTCPRCRMPHNIVGTFDSLCDGCQNIVATHPAATDYERAGIALWREKSRQHWRGNRDPDIQAQIADRQRLHDAASA